MKKIKKYVVMLLIPLFAIAAIAFPASKTTSAKADGPANISLSTAGDAWELTNIGTDINNGVYGASSDIYTVNITSATVNMAWVLALAYPQGWPAAATAGNNVTYRPGPAVPGGRVTLNFGVDGQGDTYLGQTVPVPNDWSVTSPDAPFFFNANSSSPSVITFENIDFNFYFHDPANSNTLSVAFTGNNTLIFKNCTFYDNTPATTGTYNMFNGNQGYLYLHNTTMTRGIANTVTNYNFINGGSRTNYKRVILSGNSSFVGNVNNAHLYDFRDLAINAAYADGKVTISTTGDIKRGANVAGLAAVSSGTKLYYTTDGSEPTTASAEYTEPFSIAAGATLKVAPWMPDNGLTGDNARMAMLGSATVFENLNAAVKEDEITINYEQRKIEFDGTKIEGNTKDDFTGTAVAANAAINPGDVIYFRLKASPANVLTVTVPQPAAPESIPALATDGREMTSLTFTADPELEYSIDNINWTAAPAFTGLTAATQYTLYYRYPATVTSFESVSASKMFTTLGKQATPSASDFTINFAGKTITYNETTIVLSRSSTSWSAINQVKSGTSITPGQTLYAQRKADADSIVSETFTFNVPQTTAPTADQVKYAVTSSSITFEALANAQFKLGTGEWVSTLAFEGLEANKSYDFKVRFEVTSTSFESEEYSVTITTSKADTGKNPDKSGCGSSIITNSGNGGFAIPFVIVITLIAAVLIFIMKRKTVR